MIRLTHFWIVILSTLMLLPARVSGQSGSSAPDRAQYPNYLSNAYFGVNIGYINYPFTSAHLEPGFVAESVEVPHTGVRLMLYGRRINDHLSWQISYMRPVLWVVYQNINNQTTRNSVWMNIAGFTLKPEYPVSDRLSVFGEFGLSIITRHGFKRDGKPAVRDANYASILAGGGAKYHLNDKWDLMVHTAWSPQNNKAKQPYTFFFSPGFQYNMRSLPEEKVKRNMQSGYIFPRHQFQIGYTTNAFGYGVNAFFSEKAIPVFWGGDLHVERGFSVNYNRNIFHGRKTFALDVGASAGYWETEHAGTPFYTLAVYPLLRFFLLRTKPADLYFYYAVAGPAFISNAMIDGIDTGRRFTFSDYMGTGIYAGPDRSFSAEVKIGHYSNGNLFPQNAGVKVPLTFCLGYNF